MVFPLSRTPDMFFDPELWELFVSYFDTPEIAYERIGYPPELVGYHYEDYEKRSSPQGTVAGNRRSLGARKRITLRVYPKSSCWIAKLSQH